MPDNEITDVIKRIIEKGKIPAPRDLILFVRDIKTIQEAENILKMLYRPDNIKLLQPVDNTVKTG